MAESFSAKIENAGGGGAFVTIPFDVEKVFGKKRVPVRALIDQQPYRGTLVRMGSACHMLIVRKDIREKIGKSFGDTVDVVLEEDREERTIEAPADLREALQQDERAGRFFHELSYTHRREYVMWIEDAKRPETRQRRVQQAVEMLKAGKKERR